MDMWWSQYGNAVEGFIREKARVDDLIVAAGLDQDRGHGPGPRQSAERAPP
jgi:hypothetical protein